ncbi:MAG: sigma-70 family RNA polymerase sigma factor [Elusimicrobia bacterium]|nr:sigma-70 family RNA polymerase sigma factor [Elusimicrobiota bacterium]
MEPSTDTISQYFKGIQKLAQVSREEMHELWKKAKKGDAAAKSRIMEANLRLVVPIAKKYHRQGIDFMDLVEEGNLGLMHSIDKFEPSKGYRFSTYASYWIEQSIRRAVEEQSKTIRIPPHAWEALRKWLKMWEKMHAKLGRDPSLAEMARAMHWTARQVRGVLDAAEAAKGMGSLEAPIDSEDDNITVEDMIAETTAQSPENVIGVLKLHDELHQALREIGDRERMILEFRHGLTGQTPMTLEEVGRRLRLSRERIRQIEERALLRLRRVANRMGLIELEEGGRRGHTNLQPGFSAPKLKTDILGQTIPAGRKTAPTGPQLIRRQPRKLVFAPPAKPNGKKRK